MLILFIFLILQGITSVSSAVQIDIMIAEIEQEKNWKSKCKEICVFKWSVMNKNIYQLCCVTRVNAMTKIILCTSFVLQPVLQKSFYCKLVWEQNKSTK